MTHHHARRMFPHDDEARREWQNPEAILADTGLAEGMTFADIGCGQGFFAIPAARIVGPHGKVYALDIQSDSVEKLLETARVEGLVQVVAQSGPGETIVLCDACADIVFFGIDLHDFADASAVLSNARAMIKPDGKLIDLDWKKEPMDIGPPVEIRFSEATAMDLILGAGFTVDAVREAGPHHYMIVASPAP
ncbi:MAG TPA: methyltransferase domain-containing protein [Candidatus Anoxymicrobiaceae bacterium]